MHGLSLGFDYAYIIKTLLEEFLCRTVTMEALRDRKMLLNLIAKDASTTDRRIQIHIIELRETYFIG